MSKFKTTNSIKTYPVPFGDSDIFNPNEINTGTETITLNNIDILLSNYLPLSGGTVNNLNITSGLYVDNQAQLSFGQTEKNTLDSLALKTAGISKSSNITSVSGDLSVLGNLNLSNNLNASKIGNGNVDNTKLGYLSNLTSSPQTQINDLSSSIANINNEVITINNNISNVENDLITTNSNVSNAQTSISNNTTTLNNHTTTLNTHTTSINSQLSLINTNTANISSLNIQNSINQNNINQNTSAIALNTNSIDSINSKLTNINYDSNSNETTIINDLNLDSVIINNSLSVDGTFTIQNNNYSLTDNQFNYLSSITADYATTNNNLLSQINNNSNDISTLNVATTSNTGTINNNISRLDLIDAEIVNINNDITTTDGQIIDINNDLSNKANILTQHENDIIALETQQITNTNNIQTNADNILLKQNIINSFNRLNVVNLSDGSVTNNEFNTLAGIDITKSIQTQLNTLETTLSNLNIDVGTLETLQSLDLTNIPLIQTDISNLQTQQTTNINNITTNADNIALNTTDISNLQSNVSSNTGRLNVKDSEILTINNTLTSYNTSINQNTSDILQNSGDIATNTNNISSNLTLINTKNDIIDVNNKLSSELIQTNVDSSLNTLNVILQSLTDVNTNQSTLLTNINNSIANLTNEISSNDTEILNLQNNDTIHDSLITTINGNISTIQNDITTLNSDKQDVISNLNKISSDYIETNVNLTLSDLSTVLQDYKDDITLLNSSKQDLIDVNNKLPIANVNLTGSSLLNMDYNSSIASKFTNIDNQISTLTTLQNGDVANFVAIEDNFTAIDAELLTKQDIIDTNNKLDMIFIGTGEVSNTKLNYIKNLNSDVQSQINGLISSNLPSILYDGPNLKTTITDNLKVSKLIFDDLSEQTTSFTSALKTSIESNTSDIATLQTQSTTNTNNISQNITDITNLTNTKQDLIDVNNKLPIANVDLTGSNLLNCDYNSSINTKFTNIDSSLSSQTTLNNSFTNDISTLNTNKQDLIDASNKLNPEFISTSGGGVLTTTKMQYLSSITSDLQTQLNNAVGTPFDTNNSTFTGTTVIDSLNVRKITEIIDSAIVSFTANVLTVDYSSNPSILYMDDLTSNTNFQLNLTNVPNGTYRTYTFTLWIDTSLYKAYANTIKINGTTKTVLFSGGESSIDISTASGSTLLMQQFTIFFLLSASNPDKVISNITLFKA